MYNNIYNFNTLQNGALLLIKVTQGFLKYLGYAGVHYAQLFRPF